MKENRYACADRRLKRMVTVYRGIPGRMIFAPGCSVFDGNYEGCRRFCWGEELFPVENERIALA